MGRSTKVLGNIKVPPPLKLYIQLERLTKVLRNIKVPPPLNSTFNWKINNNKVLGNIKVPPP